MLVVVLIHSADDLSTNLASPASNSCCFEHTELHQPLFHQPKVVALHLVFKRFLCETSLMLGLAAKNLVLEGGQLREGDGEHGNSRRVPGRKEGQKGGGGGRGGRGDGAPVVLQAKANLELDFCELAQVVGSFGLVHVLQQFRLQVGHKEGHCRAWGVLQSSCTKKSVTVIGVTNNRRLSVGCLTRKGPEGGGGG